MKNAVLRIELFSCKEQLGHSAVDLTPYVEVNVGRANAPIFRRVWSWLDGNETEPAIPICELLSIALKVGVEGRGISVGWMVVAAERVRLPNFDPRSDDRFSPYVQHPSSDLNDLALGTGLMASHLREIGVLIHRFNHRIKGPGDGRWRRHQRVLGPSPQQSIGGPYCCNPSRDAQTNQLATSDSVIMEVHASPPHAAFLR